MAKKKSFRVKMTINKVLFDQTFSRKSDADEYRRQLEMLRVGHIGSNQFTTKVSLAKAWCALVEDKREAGLDEATVNALLKPLRLFGPMLRRDISDISVDEFVDVFASATNRFTGRPLALQTLEGYALTLKEVLMISLELGVKELSVRKVNNRVKKIIKRTGAPANGFNGPKVAHLKPK